MGNSYIEVPQKVDHRFLRNRELTSVLREGSRRADSKTTTLGAVHSKCGHQQVVHLGRSLALWADQEVVFDLRNGFVVDASRNLGGKTVHQIGLQALF